MKRILAFSLGFFAFQVAAQERMELMGITVGDSFSVPKCQTKSLTRTYQMFLSDYEQPIRPCWKDISAEKELPASGSFEVEFVPAEGKKPYGVDSSKIVVVDGVVEGIVITTDGYKHQDSLLSALTEKFGKPSKYSEEPVQNRMGAQFTEKNAEWQVGTTKIDFSGLGSSIDFGLILVLTPKGQAFKEAQLREYKQRQGRF